MWLSNQHSPTKQNHLGRIRYKELPHLNCFHLASCPHLHHCLRRDPGLLTLQHNNEKLAYSSCIATSWLSALLQRGDLFQKLPVFILWPHYRPHQNEAFHLWLCKSQTYRHICLPLCFFGAGSEGLPEALSLHLPHTKSPRSIRQ